MTSAIRCGTQMPAVPSIHQNAESAARLTVFVAVQM
jgi:hypothetical protein